MANVDEAPEWTEYMDAAWTEKTGWVPYRKAPERRVADWVRVDGDPARWIRKSSVIEVWVTDLDKVFYETNDGTVRHLSSHNTADEAIAAAERFVNGL